MVKRIQKEPVFSLFRKSQRVKFATKYKNPQLDNIESGFHAINRPGVPGRCSTITFVINELMALPLNLNAENLPNADLFLVFLIYIHFFKQVRVNCN
jgi:hypothetical protein